MDPADEMFQLCRFDLTPLEAVAYYLPRLLSGESLNGAERLIHRADIYGDLEPNDLAAAFPPAPKAERTGARFFFTLCKRQKGSRTRSARSAGAGTWTTACCRKLLWPTGRWCSARSISPSARKARRGSAACLSPK